MTWLELTSKKLVGAIGHRQVPRKRHASSLVHCHGVRRIGPRHSSDDAQFCHLHNSEHKGDYWVVVD